MSRLDPLRERQEFIEAIEARHERSGPGELGQPTRDIDPPGAGRQRGPAPELSRSDVSLQDAHRQTGVRLRDSEIRTLADVGKFRVVAAADLTYLAYNG